MKLNPNIRQRLCLVRDLSRSARVMVAALPVKNGVRLQTGEHFGELRRPGKFEIICVVEPY